MGLRRDAVGPWLCVVCMRAQVQICMCNSVYACAYKYAFAQPHEAGYAHVRLLCGPMRARRCVNLHLRMLACAHVRGHAPAHERAAARMDARIAWTLALSVCHMCPLDPA